MVGDQGLGAYAYAAAPVLVVRERLVAEGRVGDTTVVTTKTGERIGVGDRVVSRRNDRELDVANRDAWVVTAVGRGGDLVVTPAEVTSAGRRRVI